MPPEARRTIWAASKYERVDTCLDGSAANAYRPTLDGCGWTASVVALPEAETQSDALDELRANLKGRCSQARFDLSQTPGR